MYTVWDVPHIKVNITYFITFVIDIAFIYRNQNDSSGKHVLITFRFFSIISDKFIHFKDYL